LGEDIGDFDSEFNRKCGLRQEDDELRVSVKRITFRPFSESLPESEHGNVDLMMDKYIRPYIHDHPDLVVRKGTLLY
jgi:hypothetical protein